MTYQVCTRCVMDTSDPNITFDGSGVCSWCHKVGNPKPKEGLDGLLQEVRWKGRDHSHFLGRSGYDCVIGLSGGVDSSYLAHLVKQWELRPYAITVDSAWVSPEAGHNIEVMSKAVAGLEIIELGEGFLDLQLAYLKAGALNLDIPQDHAIIAALWRTATRKGIKYILSGANQATESIHPPKWGFNNMDLTNMKAIHRRFGNGRTEEAIPTLGYMRQAWLRLRGIRVLNPLDYVDYNKEQAKELLKREYGWQDYGAKHHESIFTRWYQSAVLPKKFRIDKRRAHLSALVLSGQTTRGKALEELEKPPYSEEQRAKDREHIARALGVEEEELEWMAMRSWPTRGHTEFPTDPRWAKWVRYAAWRLKG